MEFFKKYKIAIISLILIGILFVIYTIYFKDGSDSAILTQDGGESAGVVADKELLALIQSLESITLDNALLGSAEFRSLVDFSNELRPEPIGRSNPFAPF